MENSCGGSGPFEDCWNPSFKAEPFAGHGFLAALWRAVCACSCLKLQTFQAIRYCIWLCCPEMGTAPSTVEEPAPMEEQPSFWSSELARQYVPATILQRIYSLQIPLRLLLARLLQDCLQERVEVQGEHEDLRQVART